MIRLKEAFLRIQSLCFVSHSDCETGWNGKGTGAVKVEANDDVIVFYESGKWRNSKDREFGFKNTYRWTFERNHVKLEHLRFGENNPVVLFYLEAISETKWTSVCPHKCDLDLYSADLTIEEEQIILKWKVKGPGKNEEINYWYKKHAT
jgi:Family of unknown function (DUF6314)